MASPERPEKLNPEVASQDEIEAALQRVQEGLQRKAQEVSPSYPSDEGYLDGLREHPGDDIEEGDEPVSGRLATQRAIINSELFWHGRLLDHYD